MTALGCFLPDHATQYCEIAPIKPDFYNLGTGNRFTLPLVRHLFCQFSHFLGQQAQDVIHGKDADQPASPSPTGMHRTLLPGLGFPLVFVPS